MYCQQLGETSEEVKKEAQDNEELAGDIGKYINKKGAFDLIKSKKSINELKHVIKELDKAKKNMSIDYKLWMEDYSETRKAATELIKAIEKAQ